jgi:hypothetical protein
MNPVSRPTQTLVNLAELSSSFGTLCAFWDSEQRRVYFLWRNQWYLQEDGPILSSLAAVLRYDLSFPNANLERHLRIANLRVFEGLPAISSWSGGFLDSNLEVAVHECNWSDYASDLMGFQGVIRFDMNGPQNEQRLTAGSLRSSVEIQ